MELLHVPATHIDRAWREGADALAESCVEECTGDQLKMLLSRGERQLVMLKEAGAVGWGAFRVDQLPNLRALHVTNLVAHNAHFERFLGELQKLAQALGCSQIRCSCGPVQARLYRQKCGFTPVYETLKLEVPHDF